MRNVFLVVILISAVNVKAQVGSTRRVIGSPLEYVDYSQQLPLENGSHFSNTVLGKKWFFSSFTGISAGYNFFGGMNAAVFAAPVGLQLTRKLTNNLYAFGSLAVTPAYVNFNRSFLSSNQHSFYPNSGFSQNGNLGLYSGASLGLMYVNDAKTFSVSGRFSVENSSYPTFPYEQPRAAKRSYVPAGK